jgi:two-component system, OmpR family, alkaline phosphatase synthesis response regulator PhoP
MSNKNPAKKILLVEDEPNIAFNLQFNLQAEGYEVVPAVNGLIAVEKFEKESPFDLIILDVMLPEMNGFEVAEQVRMIDDKIHILMLTALGREEDRLKGFSLGIDDYITKPFHLKELLLRVNRMIKRAEHFTSDDNIRQGGLTSYGPFTLNSELLQLTTPKGVVSLTAMEADILSEFMATPTKVLSRQTLLDRVWGMKGDVETRTVDNFIVRLRKYMEEDPAKPVYLVSVRGRGYRLIDPNSEKQ